MTPQPNSIRAFIGAKDYQVARQFYTDLGFNEYITSEKMSYFSMGAFGFYLQDYYVEDWVNNTMMFLEVSDLDKWLQKIKSYGLEERYEKVKVTGISYNDWGNEFFIYDPSGILWHIGEFKK